MDKKCGFSTEKGVQKGIKFQKSPENAFNLRGNIVKYIMTVKCLSMRVRVLYAFGRADKRKLRSLLK